MQSSQDAFLAARDFLLAHRTDYATAVRDFRWPALTHFNWALDYFDPMAQRNAAPGARRGRRGRRAQRAELRRARGALESRRQLAARARRAARRPHAAHARQRGPAVGDDARGDEARRGGDSGDDAALARRPARPRRARRRDARGGGRRRTRRSSRTRSRRLHPHRRRRRGRRLAALRGGGCAPRRASRPTARRARAIRCCSTSPRARPRSRSSCCTRTQSYPVGHLSTMYWIGLRPATSISTSPRRAGPSTPGAASSRRGTPGATVFVYNYARFDARALLRRARSRTASPRSARRRRCGAC